MSWLLIDVMLLGPNQPLKM